jgi:hypothetical protein
VPLVLLDPARHRRRIAPRVPPGPCENPHPSKRNHTTKSTEMPPEIRERTPARSVPRTTVAKSTHLRTGAPSLLGAEEPSEREIPRARAEAEAGAVAAASEKARLFCSPLRCFAARVKLTGVVKKKNFLVVVGGFGGRGDREGRRRRGGARRLPVSRAGRDRVQPVAGGGGF